MLVCVLWLNCRSRPCRCRNETLAIIFSDSVLNARVKLVSGQKIDGSFAETAKSEAVLRFQLFLQLVMLK